MSIQSLRIRQLKEWLQKLRDLLDSDLVDLVPRLWSAVKQLFREEKPPGPYEVLAYESRLELKDAKGKKAVFYKRQRVHFLQDNVIAFQDLAWGDGQIFADYQCAPGVAVDRYREGHRYRVLISLRETKNQGDVEEFLIERTIQDGFTRTVESFQTEINHPTQQLSVSVVFPRQRPPQRVTLTQQNAAKTAELGADRRRVLPDGRVKVFWEAHNPGLYEAYILQWTW